MPWKLQVSPVVKAARLVYKGRFELESLVMAMRSTLESSGWRHISSTTSSNPTTTQVTVPSVTNLTLEDVTDGKAWVVWEVDGEALPVEHGGPARLLVPHLYFWKSAKWVSGVRLLDHDEPGFWERNGYHDRGDPWLEQRYQGD